MKSLLAILAAVFVVWVAVVAAIPVISVARAVAGEEPVFVRQEASTGKTPAQIDAETSMRVAIDTNRTNNLIALSSAQMEIERQRAELNDARRLAIVNSAAPDVFAGMLIVAVLVIVVAVAAVKIMVDAGR